MLLSVLKFLTSLASPLAAFHVSNFCVVFKQLNKKLWKLSGFCYLRKAEFYNKMLESSQVPVMVNSPSA